MRSILYVFSLKARLAVSSILNAIAVCDGLRTLVKTHDASSLSPTMFVIFFFLQLTFAEDGWRKNAWGQFLGMGVSALVTAIMLVLMFVWR